MSSRTKKALQPLLDLAEELGYTVDCQRAHLKFSKPGRQPVFSSKTPSCPRAVKNACADLRRSNSGMC